MKRRNPEVNIFNMSLLDILCGALGAFCFLMLTLFPDHIKAKQLEQKMAQMEDSGGAAARAEEAERKQREAEKKAEEAKDKQSLAYMQIYWRQDVDIDIWVQMPNGKWVVPKDGVLSKDQLYGTTHDNPKGPAREQVWQADVAGYQQVRYRLFAKWQSGTPSDGQPVSVHAYMAARAPLQGESNSMSLEDFGETQIARVGDRVELGSVTFKGNDYTFVRGPSQDPPQQGR